MAARIDRRGRSAIVTTSCIRILLELAVFTQLAAANQLWFENLPDGIHDVLIGPSGGIYLTGFDSRSRTCLVLYAPPFGRPLRTISELPYTDYGRSTPAVLASHDPLHAEQIYVLLYLHPDNLGIEQTSLFRVELATGKLKLLSASSSPFWRPKALVARPDGTVLVSFNGLGPMLMYERCDDLACSPATEVHSNASSATGKGGMDEIGGMLCLVVAADMVFGEGGHLVCELPDGSLESITSGSRWQGDYESYNNREGDEDLGDAGSGDGQALVGASPPALPPPLPPPLPPASARSAAPSLLPIQNPSMLAASPHHLYVVSMGSVNEYGYAQGDVYSLARRSPQPGEQCGRSGCWSEPQIVVRSVSNPAGLTLDDQTQTLFVVERNTLHGFSYETFEGDVLSFCAAGRYDCSAAQNSGECACERGYGGSCCDQLLNGSLGPLLSLLLASVTTSGSLTVVLLSMLALFCASRQRASPSGHFSEHYLGVDASSQPSRATSYGGSRAPSFMGVHERHEPRATGALEASDSRLDELQVPLCTDAGATGGGSSAAARAPAADTCVGACSSTDGLGGAGGAGSAGSACGAAGAASSSYSRSSMGGGGSISLRLAERGSAQHGLVGSPIYLPPPVPGISRESTPSGSKCSSPRRSDEHPPDFSLVRPELAGTAAEMATELTRRPSAEMAAEMNEADGLQVLSEEIYYSRSLPDADEDFHPDHPGLDHLPDTFDYNSETPPRIRASPARSQSVSFPIRTTGDSACISQRGFPS